MTTMNYYPVDVPDGRSGEWSVRTVVLTSGNTLMTNLRALRDGNPELMVDPGTYKVLANAGGCVMSNTQLEWRTNREFVESAEGAVLVTGLGLGMILRPLLARRGVASVHVVEQSQDVINLVGPTYADLVADGRVRIFHADAWKWTPPVGRKYTCAWHDIWASINSDHLSEMTKIKARYRKWVTGAQDCWSRKLCQREKRRFG